MGTVNATIGAAFPIASTRVAMMTMDKAEKSVQLRNSVYLGYNLYMM